MLIDIQYGVKRRETNPNARILTNSEYTENYLELYFGSAYPDGLKGQKLRMFGKIMRKVGEAIDAGKLEVEFDDSEKLFIFDTVITKEPSIPAAFSRYTNLFEEEVRKLKEEKKPEPAAPEKQADTQPAA